ncbi:CheR family methyltransferase [Chloroflexota bacterium]
MVILNSDMENAITSSDPMLLDSLMEKVFQDGGYDFRNYKHGTIVRRMARRLCATKTKTYLEYIHFLDTHPEEYHKLADDLTIKVSGFFRNQHSFQQLAGLVLPKLLAYKEARGERTLRFWSAGCARGEEPYSIAILLSEFLGQRRQEFDISINATDISQWAINHAQSGIYSSQDLGNLPEAIKAGYFTHSGENYEIRADIRQMVNYLPYDLTSTAPPPLYNLDCVFCCNVLIYWQRNLQEQVLEMIYEVLGTSGYLVLGEVETPTNKMRGRLLCLDHKAKIYKKGCLVIDQWCKENREDGAIHCFNRR